MDIEVWIIAQLEAIVSGRVAPAEVTTDCPNGLVVEAEIEWYERGSVCRGVLVEVGLGAEPIGSFAYVISTEGAHAFLDRLEPDEAERIAAVIGGEPTTGLVARLRP